MKPKQKLEKKWDQLDRVQVRRLQGLMLQKFICQVVPFSKYYREIFEQNKIDPSSIKSIEDLQRIPFSSKISLVTTPEHPDRARDFIAIPDVEKLKKRPAVIAKALFQGKSAVKDAFEYEFRPIFLTSTTGRSAEPVAFVYSRYELDNLASAGKRLVRVLGAEDDDKLLNTFPYAPHLAFWQTHYATVTGGVFSVSTGGGKVTGTDGNIRLIEKIKPTGVMGMPTFLYHLLSQAVSEGRRFENLCHLVMGGEKVPLGMKKKLNALVGKLSGKEAKIVATYGFTEAKAAWGECPYPLDQAASGYHLYPDLGLIEIIDPETGQVQPDGTPGEIVYTPLDARGSFVLRYRTGDFIDGGLVYEPCPYCGRRMPRLVGNISRKSEVKEMRLDKLKGTLVDFNELEHLLDDDGNVGSWQLELRKLNDDPMELDILILHVEKLTAMGDEQLIEEINERFAAHTELRPNEIVFHNAEEMRKRHGVGKELKEKRIADNRPAVNESK